MQVQAGAVNVQLTEDEQGGEGEAQPGMEPPQLSALTAQQLRGEKGIHARGA